MSIKREWTEKQLKSAPDPKDPLGLIEARIEYKAARGAYDPDGRYAVRTKKIDEQESGMKKVEPSDMSPGSLLREIHDLQARINSMETKFQKQVNDVSSSVAEIMRLLNDTVNKLNAVEPHIMEELNCQTGGLEAEIKALKRRVIDLEALKRRVIDLDGKNLKKIELGQEIMNRFFAMFDREFPQYASTRDIQVLVERATRGGGQ